MIVKGIQRQEIDEFWPLIEDKIVAGLKYADGCFTGNDVRRSLEAGRQQLFVTMDLECAFVTEIEEYPQRKLLNIFLIAGRLPDDWRQSLALLEDWGRGIGCDGICLRGRKGWIRRLPDYKASMVYLVKDLRQ